MSATPREQAVEFILSQLRMGRAKAKDPGVALEIARDEVKYQRELDSLRLTNVVQEDELPHAVSFSKTAKKPTEGAE